MGDGPGVHQIGAFILFIVGVIEHIDGVGDEGGTEGYKDQDGLQPDRDTPCASSK